MEGEPMRLRTSYVFISLAAAVATLVACASAGTPATGTSATAVKPWFVRDGFVAPEAVRYDPDQDIYFVGN
jgi:hypothetical protein